MIDSTALRKQAVNKYPGVVESLLRGETPFPLKLRYSRVKTTDTRESIIRDIGILSSESREKLGHGLTIEWTEINTIKHGRNQIPAGVSLASEEDFLSYIGKCDEMRTIRIAAETLVQAFPNLHPQLPGLWRLLRKGEKGFWQLIVRVIFYFKESPFPDRYIRELPVEVPTKFIEENRALIEQLVGVVTPDSLRFDRETFEERLGLKAPDSLIECRLLDDGMFPDWHFRQFTVSLKDLDHLGGLPAHTVLVTENRTNFLTLPKLIGTIALQGQGYAVSRLGRVPILKNKRILYWGDLDAHGFEILAILRRVFPQVESLMMDAQTWESFAEFRVDGMVSRNSPEQYLPFLKPEEIALYQEVSGKVARLEQERIAQHYVESELRAKIRAGERDLL